MRRLLLLLFLLVLAFPVRPAAAAEPVPAAPEFQIIGRHIDILDDPDHSVTAEQVLSGAVADRFRPSPGDAPSFSRTTHAYWGRFTVRNDGAETLERLLVLAQPYYFDIRLYQSDGKGGWTERRLQRGTAERGTDDNYRLAAFWTLLPPGDTQFYVRIDYYFVSFGLTLRSVDAHGDLKASESLFFGMVFGAMLILTLYPLALALFVREGPALPLFVFCAVDGAMTFVNLGFPWVALPSAVASYSYLFFNPLAVIALLAFTRSYLQLKRRAPLAYRITIALELACAATYVTQLIAPHQSGWAQLVGIAATLHCLVTAAYLVFRQREAWLYLFGFTMLSGFGIVYGLVAAGIVPATLQVMHAIGFGRIAGTVILTFGVAYVIGKMREARMEALARSEAALRQAKEGLEDRVRERTAELAQALDELRESKDALVQSEKLAALGQLVAGVAHEINTPVGVVVTASSHLLDQTRDVGGRLAAGQLRKSELTGYLDQAVTACEAVLVNASRAAALVQSFKNVAADQVADERRSFALKDVVGEVVLSLSPHLRSCGHRLEVAGELDGIDMLSHPGALTRVLTNLVMNATIHGYEEGRTGGLIRVEVSAPSPEEVEIRVEDDGRGVPPDLRSKVFDPFFTTRRGRGGTGLGLHIVHNLVTETLRGTVRLDPAAERGARFLIRLPRQLSEARAEPVG